VVKPYGVLSSALRRLPSTVRRGILARSGRTGCPAAAVGPGVRLHRLGKPWGRNRRRTPSRQPIEPHGVVMEQFALFLLAPPADDALERLDPLFVRRRQCADRPVAAEDDAVRA